MPQKSKFIVREQELADALGITLQKLDNIIAEFDRDPHDQWNLDENVDYIFIDKTWKKRLFSQQGAYAIARYLAAIQDKNIFSKIVEFITHHKKRVRNAFIQKTILENSTSLVRKNNRHFLSRKDTVAIFATSYAKLDRVFIHLKDTDTPLIFEEDFDEIEGKRYYSLSGIDRLGRVLGSELTRKDRREWCESVHVVAKDTFRLLDSQEFARQKRIKQAMEQARNRDNRTCQITGQKPHGKHNPFNLAVHHIYSKEQYPHLEDSTDNLITLKEEVHKEFHQWNEGFQKPCTIDSLIEFVTLLYPDRIEAIVTLQRFKQRLQMHIKS